MVVYIYEIFIAIDESNVIALFDELSDHPLYVEESQFWISTLYYVPVYKDSALKKQMSLWWDVRLTLAATIYLVCPCGHHLMSYKFH